MNGIIMKSVNFEFLRDKWPELAILGGFAEQYAWPDPESALVKLRSFVEAMIHRFYDANNIPKPISDSLFEFLNADNFKKAVPTVVLNTFHSIAQRAFRGEL